MDIKNYREFVIIADNVKKNKAGLHKFTIQVFSSPVGEGEKEMRTIPPDLGTQLNKIEQRLLEMDDIIILGKALADLLLPDKTRGLFVRSLDKLQKDQGLRLRLRLASALANIPWEYMYIQRAKGEKDTTGFLALDPRISIVRHEAIPVAADIDIKPRPRRLLFALASPTEPGYADLDLVRERDILKKAIEGVKGIELDILEDATLEKLNNKLLRNADIFHFAGHGNFEVTGYGNSFLSKPGKGEILLEDNDGGGFHLPADQLAVNLQGKGVQLVILGACETGRRDEQNVWSGVVAALMEVGIPAVLAMQYKIWDDAAIDFSRSFYHALAGGLLLDQAVSAGRIAAFNLCHSNREDLDLSCFWQDWGVPVFYMRSDQNFFLPGVANADQRKALIEGPRTVVNHRFSEIGPKGIYRAIEAGVIKGGTIESYLKVSRLEGKVIQVYADEINGGDINLHGEAGMVNGEWTGVKVRRTIGGPSTNFCPNCEERLEEISKPNSKTNLIALDFTSDIERLTHDFVGRQWLLNEVDAWLKYRGKSFLILTGEPGVGKSAFAAWLTQTRKDIAAYNFCIAGRNDTIVPNTVLRSLGAQLSNFLPDYGKALANTMPEKISVDVRINVEKMTGGEIIGVIINHLHASDPKDVMEIIIRAPLSWPGLVQPKDPVILLIDSLDEAITFNKNVNLVTLLAGLKDLPPWVRILCTSRPERSALCYFDSLSPYILDAGSMMNMKDVGQYITNRIERKSMQAKIKSSGKNPDDIATKLKVKDLHKGNFLFAKVLLDDIESGQQSLDDLNALPRSIEDIYHRFLMRFKAQWEKRYQPILSILAVTRESVSEAQLANFTGIKRTTMRQSLGEIIQFLDEFTDGGKDKIYRLYHQSFRDYILDKDRNVDFWCAPEDGHKSIADYYLKTCDKQWSVCDTYGLKYLIDHVINAGMENQVRAMVLERILTDQFMKAIQERFGWLHSFMEDLEVLAEVDPRRTVSMCLKVLLQSWPNSLVFQRILRLLVHLRPAVGRIGDKRSSTHRTIDTVVSTLDKPHTVAIQLIEQQLLKVRNPRLRGIIALALGETGSKRVCNELLDMLKSERKAGSWMAADALIAMNDTGVISQLLQMYQETLSGADKERILYILGWMHAEEGRTLLSDGLASTRYRNVGRAIDLMWLLNPVESDITYLMDKLHSILASVPHKPEELGPWRNEWVQKRLVRALHKRRTIGAVADLHRLLDHIAARVKPRDMVNRSKLVDAIKMAIRDLESDNNISYSAFKI